MIRVILDTNVLVSGLLAAAGNPAKILLAWQEGAFEVVVSARLLEELMEVLARPKIARRIGPDDAREFVAKLRRMAIEVDDPPAQRGLAPDPGDDFIVAVARAASCSVIVTGDRDLRLLPGTGPRRMSPRDFIEVLQL